MSIQTRILAGGMPLIVESIPGVRSVGITWLLPAGSATDPDPLEGLSTFYSELIFRGGGNLDSRQQADALDRLGISRGCDVSTNYLRLSFSLVGDRLREGLGMMVEMVRRPLFAEDAIEPSRSLALQAIEALDDDPQQRAVLACRARHNPWPINRSGMGTPEGLERINRDDLLAGWERQIRPVGSILAIAGEVETMGGVDAIAAELDRLLVGWQGQAPKVVRKESVTKGTYEHVEDETASQVQIIVMHDAPPEPSPDSTPERVVANILSGGMASRLFTEVREKRGLCYAVSESYSADKELGGCLAYVGTAPERAQESLDVLMAELARINTPAGAIQHDELKRAMIGIRTGVIFSGESTGARAGALAGDFHRLGRARSLDEILAQYDGVTLDSINAYLARRASLTDLGKATIVTLGQKALTPPVVAG